jgi:hypothetical protein
LMRFFIWVTIYSFWAWVALYAAATAGPVEGIHYDKKAGTLTIHVQDMSLGELLQKVSADADFKFSIEADLNRPVTIDFTGVPLDQAIHRLVQPNSSAMIYSKKAGGAVVLSAVQIFDEGTPLPPGRLPPLPRPMIRNNRFSGYGGSNQAGGRFSGGGGGGSANQGGGGGGGGRNRRNRDQGSSAASPDTGSQTSGATGTTGTTGSQETAGGSSSRGGGRGGR